MPGSGKSHLLEAASAAASAGGDSVAFVPMRDWRAQHVDAVRGLDRCGLLCIDDVDAVAGDRGWEEALLALLEASAFGRAGCRPALRLRTSGSRLPTCSPS